jgi:hypothetical protein
VADPDEANGTFQAVDRLSGELAEFAGYEHERVPIQCPLFAALFSPLNQGRGASRELAYSLVFADLAQR